MKIFLPLLVSLLVFSGCGSHDVKVSPDPKGKDSGPPVIDPHLSTPGFGAGLPRRSHAAGRIFFERVLVDHGVIQTVIALSFASPLTRTKIPFGISLRLGRGLEAGPIFSVGLNQVAYLRSNGGLRSSLVATTMNSMKSQVLADFSVPVAGFSFSQPHDQLAWIDGAGKTFITEVKAKVSGHAPLTLALPNTADQAGSVEWDRHGRRLLVRTRAGTSLLYSPGEQGLMLSHAVPGTVAAAFSPDNSQMVFIKEDRSLEVIRLVDQGTPVSVVTASVMLESAQIHDLVWRKPHELSYWARLADGAAEIRTLDLSSGLESARAELSLPVAAGDGVVCPVWVGDTVYFGNFTNGEYVIERMRVLGGLGGLREIFAQPPAPDEGFICPKLESASAL